MKTKILISLISFIFLFTVYSNTLYAVTNEIMNKDEMIEKVQDEQVNKNIMDTEEKEINEREQISATYKGSICIDDPKQDESFLRPNHHSIIVSGWVVSDDSNSKMRILIDGKESSSPINRFERGDVDTIVSPDYGGKEMTPKAGFNSVLEINDLIAGGHVIRIEEISRYGDLISASERGIVVINKKYEGAICIDDPKQDEGFTRPDDKLAISGWVVSSDSNSRMRILIDGKESNSQINRFERADVDTIVSPDYGGKEMTPKAGFNSMLEINDLTQGGHVIRIEEISRYGDLISASEKGIVVRNKKYQGAICIDDPKQDEGFTRPDDKLIISGWVVSDDSNSRMRILIDGKESNNQINRFERADVDTIVSPDYGGKEMTPKAGFNSVLEINDLTQGGHVIRIEEISRYGDLISASEKCIVVINKKYEGAICIDDPKQDERFTRPDDKLAISGWVVSSDSNSRMRILIDGKESNNQINRFERADVDTIVSPDYGGKEMTPKAGFNSVLEINDLTAGGHVIRIEEISRYGDLISASEKGIVVINKKYEGAICIDDPKQDERFTRPDDKLAISGWVVSSDSNSRMRILIDGKESNNQINRFERADVDTIVSPDYGGKEMTPKAGFNSVLEINDLTAGGHVIRIEEISRYGDLISASERGIIVRNKKYQGEMCIDKPTFHKIYQQGQNIEVQGWAVSDDEYASIEIYIDNVQKANAERFDRADVINYKNQYGGKTANAGFGKTISTSGLKEGAHTVTVYQKSRYGEIIKGISVQFIVEATIHTAGAKGIDVSQYQGVIDWKSVANSGVKYAMIRIGYRGYGTGGLAEDPKFQRNFSGAVENGLKVGVYFYSTAINTAEAKRDAEYVMQILRKYGYQNKVSMPIALDLELIAGVNTRDKNVSKSMRTNIANTFGNTIANYGYTPMVYACKSFLNDNMIPSQILYDVWVAQYSAKCTYSGKYTMWQYTSTGRISGINGNVDCNICYKNY